MLLLLGCAAAVLALAFIPAAGGALEYRRTALAGQAWRLLTGHLVHVSALHGVVNVAAWLLLSALFGDVLTLRRQVLLLTGAALAIDLGLVLWLPAIAWYRGMSGVLHGLFFGAATLQLLGRQRAAQARLWPLALLAGGSIKLLLEQPAGDTARYAAWLGANVVPQAHVLGAAAGVLMAAALALAQRRLKSA
jgi:rhomboid family GlyGly-CTERM serine protease